MRIKVTLLAGVLALAVGVGVAGASTRTLAKDSTTGSFASIVYSTDLKWDSNYNTIPQPYFALVLKVTAPRRQIVKTKWSLMARRGDFSREISGTITRAGSFSRMIRPPMASADYLIASISASRDWQAGGRMTVSLLGMRDPA